MKAIVFILSTSLAAVFATQVEQCPGMSIANLSERTRLEPCKRVPCRLKHNTDTRVELEFTPDKDIQHLKNEVNAEVLGVPLPFPGVDGASVCEKIYLADQPDTKAPCPLKAGTKYVYKDAFPVLSIYPPITTRIHWALRSGKRAVTCFEVGAKIVR